MKIHRKRLAAKTNITGSLQNQIQSMKGKGEPLLKSSRDFFQPRFNKDFSQVRIHTGSRAAEAAKALNAKAFTWGRDMVFGAGQYSDNTAQGKRLIAHELTHVAQQKGISTLPIQRKIKVKNPTGKISGKPDKENWQVIRDYVKILSPSFVVKKSGDIVPSSKICKTTPTRITDRCLCGLHRSTKKPWEIVVSDTVWPHTSLGYRQVYVQSPRSFYRFKAWGGGKAAGRHINLSNPRILGHELCGHAWLHEQKKHPKSANVWKGKRLMGRKHHDPTIKIANRIEKEIAKPGTAQIRGTYKDPHHGESLALVTVTNFPLGYTSAGLLSNSMKKRLKAVSKYMKKEYWKEKGKLNVKVKLKADIIGHSDHGGTKASIKTVARARAYSVRNWLIKRGVSASQFKAIKGVGSSKCPSSPKKNPSCRKVDIYMFLYEGGSQK